MTIMLENVKVSVPDDRSNELLKNINLTFEEGTVTLLIGHTGSGKSTLLQVLAGILEPSSGSVMLDRQPIWDKGKVQHEHLLRLGLTFQLPEQQLFARSVSREFAYSLRPYRLGPKEQERRIREARGHFDPQGVFAADRSPFALSGGEQRRLALATTFAAAPDWLLMDEPTAGMEAAAARELLRLIREREKGRGGFVIATHDLDAFFPLADRVIVMSGGMIAADESPAALCREPELLVRAGVGLPSCVEIAQALASVGAVIAPDLLTPAHAAQAIAAELSARPARSVASAPRAAADAAFAKAAVPAVASANAVVTSAAAPTSSSALTALAGATRPVREAAEAQTPTSGRASRPSSSRQSFWYRMDPRAKWLLYLLLVIGAMLQQQWVGLAAAAAAVSIAFIGLPRSILRGGVKIARPFIIFMVVSVILAGMEVWPNERFPIGFSVERAWSTLLNVTRLLIVVIAGYWLSVTTSYGQLVQGLNWVLRYFAIMRLPVQSFALAVSLIFRFIPLILREWQRFATIVRARGKAALRPGSIRARDIPALVTPLLLAMFYKAEEMAAALEMKKIDGKSSALKSGLLRWRIADTLLVAVGMFGFGLLVLIRK